MRLAGRTALVTGASRNIGRAIALAFAAEGANLVLNTRVNAEELEAVATECRKTGVRVLPVLADIADADAVAAMVRRALTEMETLDAARVQCGHPAAPSAHRDLARGVAPRARR